MRFTIEFNENDNKEWIKWLIVKVCQILPYSVVEDIDKHITYDRKIQFTNIVELVNQEFMEEIIEELKKTGKVSNYE